jgi:hypothetical protein
MDNYQMGNVLEEVEQAFKSHKMAKATGGSPAQNKKRRAFKT